MGDSVNYVRVQKAFLDDETSALLLAKEVDSIYYQNTLTVTISNNLNTVVETLSYQNANALGINKPLGTFAHQGHVLYQMNGILNPTARYALTITNLSSGRQFTGSTDVVDDFRLVNPPAGGVLNFSDTLPFNILWLSAQNAYLYEIDLEFNYLETSMLSGATVLKQVVWPIKGGIYQESLAGGEQMKYTINERNQFLYYLASQVPASENVTRTFSSARMLITAGGYDVGRYIQINDLDRDFALSFLTPSYSNIEGGVGVFSSRYIDVNAGYSLSNSTLFQLQNHPVMADRNFN